MFTLNPADEANQKKLIGEFFVQFDQSLSVIPFVIPHILFKGNLTEVDKKNIETILSGYAASSLRSIFDSLLVDNYSTLPALVDLNSELSARMDKIATLRNSFAHGSYRIGWKNFNGELDKDYFLLRHSKATKKGFKKNSGIYHISQLEDLIQQLKLIFNAYIKISSIVRNFNMQLDISVLTEQLRADLSGIDKITFNPIDKIS